MTNEIIVSQKSKPITASSSVFNNIQAYNEAKEMGKALAASTFVPESFRGNNNLGNILIAINLSRQLDVDVLYLMRHLYVIYGKPAFESKFQIAMVNRSGNLKGRLQFEEKEGKTRAYGIDAQTGERLNGPWVDIDMAKREGWYNKKGSKWQTMPDLMKRYRAASFFINTYMPEVTAGIQANNEIIDMGDAEIVAGGYVTPSDVPRETLDVGDAQIYEDEPEEPKKNVGEEIKEAPEEKMIEDVKEIIEERIPYTTTMGQERDKEIQQEQSIKNNPAQELIDIINNSDTKEQLMEVLSSHDFVNLEFEAKRKVMNSFRKRSDEINTIKPEFTDKNGETFDASKHSWSRTNNAPSMNQDGTFRLRRGYKG